MWILKTSLAAETAVKPAILFFFCPKWAILDPVCVSMITRMNDNYDIVNCNKYDNCEIGD